MHKIYRSAPKPDPDWTARAAPVGTAITGPARSQAWGAKVVLHLRLGDVNERALPVGYYVRAVELLRRELSSASARPPLFRVQTNGLPADVAMMRRQHGGALGRPDVLVDFSKYSPEVSARVPLGLAFHRMVTANYLVMARSALSMAAALLSNGTVFFPRCWLGFRRPLPHWRLLDCCANASEAVKGANCVTEGRQWRLVKGERVRAG